MSPLSIPIIPPESCSRVHACRSELQIPIASWTIAQPPKHRIVLEYRRNIQAPSQECKTQAMP